MMPIRILVDSFADEGLTNAQMGNAREIVRRLDPEKFQVSIFHEGEADPRIVSRANTRLIPLPHRLKTPRILREFVWGNHEILFYLKSSPASKAYTWLRSRKRDHRITIGTMESQSNLKDEPTINREAIGQWEKTVLRCDYLFSNSQCVRENLRKEYDLESEIVRTGVDTALFQPLQRKPNPRVRVLYAGALRPFKQPDLVLEAAARFPGADFVIAGEGFMAADLRAQVDRERLANVTLAGPLSQSDLLAAYQAADIFLFPSKWEGSPKVILEAAACGLPVIARNDYRPESVIDGETGFAAASNEELLVRLEQLLGDEALRSRLGRNGRRHSLQFDWDVITRRWEEIFLRLGSELRGGNRRVAHV